MKHLSLLLIGLFMAGQAFGQSCKDVSVELSAVVQNSPPKITLNWVGNGSATLNTVYRKLKTESLWGNAVTTLNGSATQFVDSLVTVGVSYEYEVTRTASSWTGYGYINTGIAIPVIEARGILILIVDSTFAGPLATELKRLENDLEGDGWKNLGPLVGPANVAAADYFTTMADSSYLWSYGCGGGTFTSAGGIGNTTDFAVANLHSVFTMLFGSYFGDWDSQNNFLRAPLA